METESAISKWYRGKAIFITGATGFMGQVLLEKLLRSCPEVGPIYVLVRDKKKMRPQDRVDEIMRSCIFDEVRAMSKHREDWILPIPGDASLPDLGISVEDKRILQETVSVVFNLAATVRFDESLRIAVKTNLEGARALMQLCLGMTNLSALVHVSTAYANCNRSVIEERIYPPPAEPDKVVHCVMGMDDDLLELITPRLIGDHPNTYTFSKALAEHVIAGYSTKLPIVVVRPSIVSVCWREPIPGWTNNFNGTNGVVASGAKGLLNTIYGNGDSVMDMIPVDVCINLFIAAAWEIGSRKSTRFSPDVLVYNCVSGPFKPVTWGDIVVVSDNCTREYITSDVFMTPHCSITNSRVKHILTKALFQTLRAAAADFFVWLFGGKPKFRYYQRCINKTATVVEYFMTREWQFEARNVEQLNHQLSQIDREIFDFDMTKMDWTEYFCTGFLGIRRYLLNDKDETLQAAREKFARWTLLMKTVQFTCLAIAFVVIFTLWMSWELSSATMI